MTTLADFTFRRARLCTAPPRAFCLVLLTSLLGISGHPRAAVYAADWKAGVAKQIITPEKAVWLPGQP